MALRGSSCRSWNKRRTYTGPTGGLNPEQAAIPGPPALALRSDAAHPGAAPLHRLVLCHLPAAACCCSSPTSRSASGSPGFAAWHYRVLRHPDGPLTLHEVYCNETGRPKNYTERLVAFQWTPWCRTPCAVRHALDDAANRPVLGGARSPSLSPGLNRREFSACHDYERHVTTPNLEAGPGCPEPALVCRLPAAHHAGVTPRDQEGADRESAPSADSAQPP